MKQTGFLFRIIPVLLAAVLLVGALPAAAAEPEAQPAVELTAAREGSQISVKIKTLSQIGIDGMTFSFDYDSSAFAFSEVVSDWFGDPAVNENEKLVMLTSGSSETFPAGTVLAELKFSTGDAYVMGNEYTFTVTFSEVVDADLNGYDWQTAAISAVLKEAEVLDIEFNHSCSFDNNLTINYYAPAAALEGYDTFRLVLQKQVFNGDGSSCSWDEYEITDCVDRTSGGKRYKVFSFSNIAAMEMGNEISAVLYAEKEGRLYQSPEDKYSVKTYAYSRLEKSTDGNFKRLLADMLNYGTAAQVYFNYNTGHPVNEEMTEEHKGYASPMPELVSIENLIETDGATAQYYGKTVEMNSSVEMKYYMTFDSGAPADTVRLVLSYTPVGEPTYTVSIPASQFEYRSSYNAYSAKLSSITAKDMSCKVTAKIYDGDTLISDILEYSIETYAYNRLEKSTDENFKTLVREMMKYGKSAENYFQNKQ